MKHWKTKFLELCYEGIESNIIISSSAAFGVFMGIVPLWGFQMIIAVLLAHLLRLNKPIVLLFSNISIPIMIPFILFASIQTGSLILNQQWQSIDLQNMDWQFCGTMLIQYILGSIVFAVLSALVCFCCCWAFLVSVRKKAV